MRRFDIDALRLVSNFKGEEFIPDTTMAYSNAPKHPTFFLCVLYSLRQLNYFSTNFKKKTEDKYIGDGLNEAMRDMITLIQFFNEHKEQYKDISSIDELLYGFKLPNHLIFKMHQNDGIHSQSYKPVELLKLLLIACDNNLREKYSDINSENVDFANTFITLNYKKYLKNDLIYAASEHTKEFGENFDKVVGMEGSYNSLLETFDSISETVKKGHQINKRDVAKFILLVDKFKECRYDSLVRKGAWSKPLRDYHDIKYFGYRSLIITEFGIGDYLKESVKEPKIEEKKTNKLLQFLNKKKKDNE